MFDQDEAVRADIAAMTGRSTGSRTVVGFEALYASLSALRTTIANVAAERDELRRRYEQMDNTICWNVHCVHQADYMDSLAAFAALQALIDRVRKTREELVKAGQRTGVIDRDIHARVVLASVAMQKAEHDLASSVLAQFFASQP